MLPPSRNPLLYRGWRTSFRFGKFLGITLVVFTMLALVFLYVMFDHAKDYSYSRAMPTFDVDWPAVFRTYAITVLCVQVFLSFYFAMGLTLESVSTERMQKTHEFLITLPIAPVDKVIGLIIGQNMFVIYLVLAMTPLSLFFGLAGGLSLSSLGWIYVVIAAGFITSTLLGVALSGFLGRPVGWLLVIILLVVSVAITHSVVDPDFTSIPLLTLSPYAMVSAAVVPQIQHYGHVAGVFLPGGCRFFQLAVPWQACPLSFFALIAVFSFIAAARKLAKPSQPAFSRPTFIAGFIVLHLLLTGFLSMTVSTCAHDSLAPIAIGYLFAFYVVVLMLGLFGMPDYGQLMLWAEDGPGPMRRVFTQPGLFTNHWD